VGKACPELDEGRSVPTLNALPQLAINRVGTLRFAHPTPARRRNDMFE
jgi:hypothetical protein